MGDLGGGKLAESPDGIQKLVLAHADNRNVLSPQPYPPRRLIKIDCHKESDRYGHEEEY